MSAALLLCLVVGISDGDSLTVRCGKAGAYERVRVRVAAIDAPERRQAYSQKARQNLSGLCYRQEAELRVLSKDRFGRTVADVRCKGQDVARVQVAQGMAWVAPGYAQRHGFLYKLQDQAQRKRLGLWAQKKPTPPWAFRHKKQGS